MVELVTGRLVEDWSRSFKRILVYLAIELSFWPKMGSFWSNPGKKWPKNAELTIPKLRKMGLEFF